MQVYVIVKTEDIEKAMHDIADMIFSESQKNLTNPVPYEKGSGRPASVITDTGALLQSGRIEKTENGVEIVYDSPTASFVEYGTEPHFPPRENIKKWAMRKLGKSEAEAENISWAICKRIARDGTPPHPFIRPAIKNVQKKLKAR